MTVHSVEQDYEVVEERGPLELTPEMEARREAALKHVRKYGDPVLRAKALPVEHFDGHLTDEIMRMESVMSDAFGVGLAATQLGILHRLLVYTLGEQKPLVALVNPEIEWYSPEKEVGEEGCLSLPGVVIDVERSLKVRVKARDDRGEELKFEAEGIEARVIQHEVDHLDGILTIDRAPREERREAMRILRGAADR